MMRLVCSFVLLTQAFAQNAPMPRATVTAAKAPLTAQEKEVFLLTGKIVTRETLAAGTTKTSKVVLDNGSIRHEAHLQCLDMYKPVFRGREGTVEKNFRDTYKFNIAAYRLGKLLGIGEMIPPSVEREIDGKACSLTWWVDDVWLTEADRRDKQIKPPATQNWVDQLNKVRVFDQLIYNTDRNQGNLLITKDWRLYMIDHTRAFRVQRTLLKPDALGRCDYNLLNTMRNLSLPTLTKELSAYLRAEEIASILPRRDLIVRHFDTQVAGKGQDAVLTGIPRSTPNISVP